MDQALQTMISNMPEKTGKSLEEWKQVLKSKSFTKHGEAVNLPILLFPYQKSLTIHQMI